VVALLAAGQAGCARQYLRTQPPWVSQGSAQFEQDKADCVTQVKLVRQRVDSGEAAAEAEAKEKADYARLHAPGTAAEQASRRRGTRYSACMQERAAATPARDAAQKDGDRQFCMAQADAAAQGMNMDAQAPAVVSDDEYDQRHAIGAVVEDKRMERANFDICMSSRGWARSQ
jgi:hypothetical protein